MSDPNAGFFKHWREQYEWPIHSGRRVSEERVFCLERLVKENILMRGPLRPKQVLLCIVDWKTSGSHRHLEEFGSFPDQEVEDAINAVRGHVDTTPDDVCYIIRRLRDLGKATRTLGPSIAVTSAILRFLDPITHRYGIIDPHVADFTNENGITSFTFRGKYVATIETNILEYQKFHTWLQQETVALAESSYQNIYGELQKFRPADIDMAIFSYKCKQSMGVVWDGSPN